MSAKTYSVYEGDGGSNPPARPTEDDMGGATLIDRQESPPDPETHPTSAGWNQKIHVSAAHARVVPTARIQLEFLAGVPTVTVLSSVNPNFEAADISKIDNANGDTSLTWTATKLPPPLCQPSVSQFEDIEIDRIRCFLIAGGVRVKTKLGATGTDCGVIIDVY